VRARAGARPEEPGAPQIGVGQWHGVHQSEGIRSRPFVRFFGSAGSWQ
jgi:hypothetical protein